MEKLKMHSPDLTDENITRISELFPDCVTETKDENGKLRYAVDFDQLKQELSDHIVDGSQERYQLGWPGKREALLSANAPVAKTLRPSRAQSVNFDSTQNLFIEGDNLDALKLLQETYLGKVKMIYIDPPYNTGNDFVFDDDFAENYGSHLVRTNQQDESGTKLVANTVSNGRFHSDWLSMIYSRLRVARNLLSEDGAIFLSIDDVEMPNALSVMREIFGLENFVANFLWKSRQTPDSRKRTRVSTDHEYVICFAKSIDSFSMAGKDIDKSKYSNPDNDPRGPWASENLTVQATKDQRPNQFYEIVDPKTGIKYPANPLRVWAKSKANIEKMIEEDRILFPTDEKGRPREKKFLLELESEKTGFSSLLDNQEVGYTTNGTRDLSKLFEGRYFNFPKPVALLSTLFRQATSQQDIILDFFAGSGSTAHAVFDANSRDGGNRKFILIQIPEELKEDTDAWNAGYRTICDISKDRIRRSGEVVLEQECSNDWGKDVGFRALEIDTSNMADVYYTPGEIRQSDLLNAVENIKPERDNPEDLLFQVLVDWGVDLSLPIRSETTQGKTVFYVNEEPYDLVACFDTGITEELVKELARHEPMRVVFRDNSFVSDAVKINVDQIFRQLSPATDVKSI